MPLLLNAEPTKPNHLKFGAFNSKFRKNHEYAVGIVAYIYVCTSIVRRCTPTDCLHTVLCDGCSNATSKRGEAVVANELFRRVRK